jgi:hypothetical protein
LSLAAREVSRQFAADNPSMADNVRLFLIIMESNVSHCLWEQVMTLSKLADPSIADDVKVLLDYCGVEPKPLSLGTSNELIKAADHPFNRR